MGKYLVAATAAVVVSVFVSAGVAFGASVNTAGLDATFNPSATGATPTKGGLFVETSTLHDNDPSTDPTNPTLEPLPTTNVELDFDHNITFAVGSVPTCNAALGGTTQQGMKACGASYIGGGYATVCGATGGAGTACDLGILNAQVAAYNGPRNANNQPTIRLQARADHTPVGPLTAQLTGALRNSPAGGEFTGGKRLVVPVPLIPPAAPGLAAITDFAVNINNNVFVKAKCDGDQVWNFRARYEYAPAAGFDTVNDGQACT